MRSLTLWLCVFVSLAFRTHASEFPIDIANRIISSTLQPVDRAVQKRLALESAAQTLGAMGEAEFAAVIPGDRVVAHVQSALQGLPGAELRQFDVTLDEGQFVFSGSGTFSQNDLTIDAAISGTIAIAIEKAELRFLPAVDMVQVAHVELGEGIQASLAEAAVRSVLPQFAGSLSAVLTSMIAPLPLDFEVMKLDTAKQLQAFPMVRAVSGPVLSFATPPERPVVLVAPEAIYLLAQLPGSAAGKGPVPEASYESLRNAFTNAIAGMGGQAIIDRGGVAIRRAAMARYLNEVLPNQTPLISVDVASEEPVVIPVSEKIELADRPNTTCKATQDCSIRRNCVPNTDCSAGLPNCSQPHDTRNCSACILRNPFGGCTLRGNDPVCEASKALQNTAYLKAKVACEADKTARRAECETTKSVAIGACEAEKLALKASCEVDNAKRRAECEAKKGLENLLAELGGVGKLTANIDVSYTGRIEVTSLTFAPTLDVDARVTASAEATARGPVSFTPYDVAGHLICNASWERMLAISAATKPTALQLSASIQSVGAGANFALELHAAKLEASSKPPLRAFFDANPDIRIICPGLNVVDLASDAVKKVTGEGLNANLDGNYEIDLPVLRLQQPIEAITLDLGSQSMTLAPSVNETSLLFTLSE